MPSPSKKVAIKKIILSILSLIILFFTCQVILKSAGVTSSSIGKILLLCILIIFLSSSKKVFWFLVFPMVLIYAIYAPIGLIFGIPSYQYIVSMFATDSLESGEFVSQIPLINYVYPFLIIGGLIAYRYITVKFNIKFYRNKTLVSIFIIFAMFNQSPFQFFKAIINSVTNVKKELVELNEFTNKSEWGDSTLDVKKSDYDNYILVIGESARRDYHHAYGYPINNTPFMSSSKGLLVNGLTSGGVYTIGSLRLMLTKPDTKQWEPNYNLNFIGLAKSAGIKTYWISNQGFTGQYDTPISYIANNSDKKYFLKYGDYESKNTSDFELLTKVEDVVNNNENQKKLIVIHLMGSHPDACQRIVDYKKIVDVKDPKYNYLDCYISSINKTDDFLKQLNEYLMKNYRSTNKSYSMIYFSDHGLVHQEVNDEILFNNSRVSKAHYNIVLFKTSSNDGKRKECNSFKSGLNFTNGIASWIGINNKNLDTNYSLFDCKDDPNDYGLKQRIDAIKDEPDPAIDLTDK